MEALTFPLKVRIDSDMIMERLQYNIGYWNELADIHQGSSYYDTAAFFDGASTLRDIEVKQLGNITGKKIIHLQCHIGLDSLSLARNLNAIVTGIDYSENSIRVARKYAERASVDCEFHCLRIGEVYQTLERRFDIVYTSYGVLCWLDNLKVWAQDIASLMAPGGEFHLIDDHPFACVFSGDKTAALQMSYPYFVKASPYVTFNNYSYAGDGRTLVNNKQYKWGHSMSEIFNCLTDAGLKIVSIDEYHKSFYNILPNMSQREDGWWYLNEYADSLPLVFSLKALKL